MPLRLWAAIASAVGLRPTHVNKIVCRSRRSQLHVLAAPQDADVGALLQQRTLLRQRKAFAEADALLDRAKQFGAIVRDHANGTSTYTLRRRATDAPSVLSLAKAARDYAVRGDLSDSDVAEYVAARAEEAREALAEPDAAPGRQASDAAFAFAEIYSDPPLMDDLGFTGEFADDKLCPQHSGKYCTSNVRSAAIGRAVYGANASLVEAAMTGPGSVDDMTAQPFRAPGTAFRTSYLVSARTSAGCTGCTRAHKKKLLAFLSCRAD